MRFKSLNKLLEYRAGQDWEKTFILSPETGAALTYGNFYTAVRDLACCIQPNIRQGQRIALIAENGLHWGIVFCGILLAGGVAVPLNPRFKPAETEELLRQAQAKLIFTDARGGEALPPPLAANSRKISVAGEAMGIIGSEVFAKNATQASRAQWEDEALVLFTSGSTGAPKGVVLTHGNLLAEAEFITGGHQLTAADVVLCILPFFHINGLVITLLSSLYSGGTAVIPRKFSASHFWQWVSANKVTWFSAVPAILSILLSGEAAPALDLSRLRFARSASSSLPVAILTEFERRYGVPVIEAYGLSEAGSQIATNPLPPRRRKAGSVGLPVGNEIQVIDQSGEPAPVQATGEVVVKGANITKGYLNNRQANRESFKNGWFHTGDLGFFDADGYLFLTGRKKELINRGGEKISPREVDEVIYRLSEIETAVTVGVADAVFGEEVVAFVQLRPGKQLTAEGIAAHCRSCLADFKIPKKIFFINDFPKGPNGKIQRRKLVELYGLLIAGRPGTSDIEKELSGDMAHAPKTDRKYNVRVYEEGCKECGYCIEVCPRQVFTVARYFNDKGYRPVRAEFADRCIGCRRCFFLCPDFSIDVTDRKEEDER